MFTKKKVTCKENGLCSMRSGVVLAPGEHLTDCPEWKPLWVRVRDERQAKYGRVAEHGLDRS